jgi:hypothetical protein
MSPSVLGVPPPHYDLGDRRTLCRPTRLGFAASVSIPSETTSFHDALSHPEWQLAMAEIAALERTSTWDLVPLPSFASPITCKWVYKIKTRFDGSIERYKARLHVVFNKSMGVTMRRPLFMLPIRPPFTLLLLLPLFAGGLSHNLM